MGLKHGLFWLTVLHKQHFPPCLTFLASVFGTFLTRFSRYLEEITSPYLIKKVSRRGIEPGPPG